MHLAALLFPLILAGSPPRDSVQDPLMGPGVSRELAERRKANIRGVQYDLALDVTSLDTARGRVTMRFSLRAPQEVIIDFRGPRLGATRVNGRALSRPEFNGAHIRIPSSVVRAGANRIDFDFAALIAPAGASIIRVRDLKDSSDYLYTLLVPADANQLFPCFDQPDLKARVTLTLTTPLGWRAVANGPRLRADSTSRGTTFSFRETEPISTYLIAFAAGPWAELRSGDSRKAITLFVRKSRLPEVEGENIILATDSAAMWLERYFDSPYPFQKLDVVLAPAFPFGGMEHPGAIFYSEERFIFRERPTLPQRLARTATIYHEVAHQWFGDLVTMRWFDDLWLKEGFATYMAAKMQAALDPASGSWKSFYLRNKPSAYEVDVSEGTTPVWQRLANLDQAKSNYGPIVYNKAPSVLKQLEHLVGDSVFQSGVRRFLKQHAYDNATWRELLDAIAEPYGHSLGPWGDEYILRPGMPVLEQQIEALDGRITRLALIQRPARPAISGTRPWPIRLDVILDYGGGRSENLPVTVSAETTVVAEAAGKPVPRFIFANARDHAYALVLLDERSVLELERSIGDVADPFLRTMLWGAMWDLVRDARLSPDRFVALAVRELPRERDEQLVAGILQRLTRASGAYLSPAQRAAILPALEQALLAGVADTSRSYGVRKAHLDAFIRAASTEGALASLDALLDSTAAAGEPLRAPTRWSAVTRLIALGAPSAERRLAAETARDATPDGARRRFVAEAARPDSATKTTYFRRYFADAALNEDWATASLDAFNTIEQQSLTRPWLVPALDSLPWIQKNRRIFFVGAWIDAFVRGQTGDDALETVRRFLADRPTLPADLRAKVLQSVDELERTARIRRAFGTDSAIRSSPGA